MANTNSKKNILLLCGGGGSEHNISLLSAEHIKNTLDTLPQYNYKFMELKADRLTQFLEEKNVDFVIPCIHGRPGETGDIQSNLEFMGIPYLGCGPEASKICWNKITSKLWFSALGIPNTPYIFLTSPLEIDKALAFFKVHQELFVKASSEGSSVGCYPVKNIDQLKDAINEAFKLSPYVLIERKVIPRELEVSAYEYQGELVITKPGEIKSPGFYSFEEKYDKKSHTTTDIVAQNVAKDVEDKIKQFARLAFLGLKLKHLARIDFFLTKEGDLYLNEINTFPGMTPISMFPKMMENHGHSFRDFLRSAIEQETKSIKKTF